MESEVTEMAGYIALLRKDATSDFGVNFPDFPGCFTAGRTLEEVRRMAAEALATCVEGMIEDGEPIPAPSTLDAVMANPENHDAVAFVVNVEVPAIPYPYTVHQSDDGAWQVRFPDVPEALTEGETEAEARALAPDALVAALGGIEWFQRRSVPPPSPPEGRPVVMVERGADRCWRVSPTAGGTAA